MRFFATSFIFWSSLFLWYTEAHAISFLIDGIRIQKNVRSMKEIKKENIVSQSLDYSCGAAGICTIFNYHLNDPVSERDVISSLLKSVDLEKVKERRGFSLLDLKKFAEARGYQVTGYKMDFDFLSKIKDPVLVPIKFKSYRHFVIVKGVVGDRVYLADPAVGNVTMKINKFESIWLNGVGLVIVKEDPTTLAKSRLAINEDEALFVDYKNVTRNALNNIIRTWVHIEDF